MKKISVALLFVFGWYAGLHANGTYQITRREYADAWKKTAIEQMNAHKIPASITLAQGILESGSGNSKLAREGNNHFGIKCHGWTGKTMLLDDDKPNECFRVYESATESYTDHSLFLKKYKRYESLFLLPSTDYKAWAKGLKEAGYATSPTYANMLIEIIEELALHELDVQQSTELSQSVLAHQTITTAQHTVHYNTLKVKYIIAKAGDTYYRISREFGVSLWQLYRYNDFAAKKDCLAAGDIVYLHPKRSKGKEKFVRLDDAMTLREFSQRKGLKLDKLMKRNKVERPDDILPKGEKIILR
jgi:uncharacterized FlgJ-related protein